MYLVYSSLCNIPEADNKFNGWPEHLYITTSVYVASLLSHICTEHYITTSVYVASFSLTSALNITSLQVCM